MHMGGGLENAAQGGGGGGGGSSIGIDAKACQEINTLSQDDQCHPL